MTSTSSIWREPARSFFRHLVPLLPLKTPLRSVSYHPGAPASEPLPLLDTSLLESSLNIFQVGFQEPRLLVVTEPRLTDHQPLTEVSYVNLPTSLCSGSHTLSVHYVDIAILMQKQRSLFSGWCRLGGSKWHHLLWTLMGDNAWSLLLQRLYKKNGPLLKTCRCPLCLPTISLLKTGTLSYLWSLGFSSTGQATEWVRTTTE